MPEKIEVGFYEFFRSELGSFEARLNRRFDEIDKRFDKLEARFDRWFDKLEARFDKRV